MPMPESRITLPITEPRVSAASATAGVAPSTICVAFSERAASTSASPTSAPTTSRYVPPSSSRSSRCCGEQLRRGAASPSCGSTWTATQVALRALGDAGGAADEPLAVRRAREGDEHALARLPRLGRCRAARGSRRAPRRRGRRARAARARAARPGCRGGSSSPARRRFAPAGRRCRARAGAAAPPAPCRRAGSGRRGARPRPGSSRAA